ncbi:MAG TPA: hypothetical protein VF193_03420 [Steroidobacter sp.]
MKSIGWVAIGIGVLAAPIAVLASSAPEQIDPWQAGELIIHHISTGRGNAAFIVFPDGTTMLLDAGDAIYKPSWAPLKPVEPRPNAVLSAGQVIARYITQAMPGGRAPRLDYAVITHFHADHFGNGEPDNPLSPSRRYRLSGITEVAQTIPIGTLIDRAYPTYDVPRGGAAQLSNDRDFVNYRAFIEERAAQGLTIEALQPGSASQIREVLQPHATPGFHVRNVKANLRVWDGDPAGAGTLEILSDKDVVDARGRFNENIFSLALTITYGRFDYYTGGDNPGLSGPDVPGWLDVETAMAGRVGEVDVMTLNHHGNRDATNRAFLAELKPRVVVLQTWISDQPGEQVLHRLADESIYPGPRDILATSMASEKRMSVSPAALERVKSFDGHVVIRVARGGDRYSVIVLDDHYAGKLNVLRKYGPYISRD